MTDPSITGTSINSRRDQEETGNVKQRAHWDDCPGGYALSCVIFASAFLHIDMDSTSPGSLSNPQRSLVFQVSRAFIEPIFVHRKWSEDTTCLVA